VDARRAGGLVLLALGIVALVVGVIRVAGGDDGTSASEPAPTASPEEPSPKPTPEPTAEPEPSVEPTAEPSPEPPVETPDGFIAALGEALAGGDARFLFSRLHAFVFERYGEDQCRASLRALDVPDYAVEVLAVEGEGPFVYETDDLRRRVRGATMVRIRATEDGDTFVETDAHFLLEDGRYLWFTDCGTPLPGAP
jgi:hypothetical protein